jgi:hypothetical protein
VSLTPRPPQFTPSDAAAILSAWAVIEPGLLQRKREEAARLDEADNDALADLRRCRTIAGAADPLCDAPFAADRLRGLFFVVALGIGRRQGCHTGQDLGQADRAEVPAIDADV